MNFITPKELHDELKNSNTVILDVREAYERAICSVDSLFIPMGEIIERHKEIPTDKKVVVLCKSGKRAEGVVHLLESEYGFSNLFILKGGITDWITEIDNNLEIY